MIIGIPRPVVNMNCFSECCSLAHMWPSLMDFPFRAFDSWSQSFPPGAAGAEGQVCQEEKIISSLRGFWGKDRQSQRSSRDAFESPGPQGFPSTNWESAGSLNIPQGFQR